MLRSRIQSSMDSSSCSPRGATDAPPTEGNRRGERRDGFGFWELTLAQSDDRSDGEMRGHCDKATTSWCVPR